MNSYDHSVEDVTADNAAAQASQETTSEGSRPDLALMQKKISEQEQSLLDLTLRHAAEIANLRARHAQQIELTRKFALEQCLKDLLPIMDSLEQAQQTDDSTPDNNHFQALKSGVEATSKLLLSLLKAHYVTAIEAINVPFNPLQHHAMNTSHDPNLPVNAVIHVYQKGYLLRDRLLRPAMVSVNHAPPSSEPT